MRRLPATLVILALVLSPAPAQAADLRGHGGPVGALAARDGAVLSGSFDTRAIVWDGENALARRVLRFHEGAVTATAFLPNGGYATAGQDGRVAVWGASGDAPLFSTSEHQAPVSALSLSPDGAVLAAASWDGRIQRIALANGRADLSETHQGMATGLAHLDDGSLVSVGSDLRLVIDAPSGPDATIGLPASPNGLAIADGRVAVIFADGALRVFGENGQTGERILSQRPLVAVAARGDLVAAASVGGEVWILANGDLSVRHAILPRQGPIWSLAFTQDALLTGGADGLVRVWDVETGEALGEGGAAIDTAFDDGSRGAEVWRSCALCHSLSPDGGERAGPTLHGVFGRRAGAVAGYDYSDALRGMDIVWDERTIAELFEFGPDAYTPGSRMPDQRVPAQEDRRALVEFLARATR